MNDNKEHRQDALYGLLLERGDNYTFQSELHDQMKDYYPELGGRKFHDTTARLMMSADITEINRSTKYEKMIISTPKGVKLATREEARKMLSGRQSAVMREIHDLNIMLRKLEKDGQRDAEGATVQPFVGA